MISILLPVSIGTVIMCHVYISWIYIFVWEKKGRTLHRSVPKSFVKSAKKPALYLGVVCLILAAGLFCSFFAKESICLYLRVFILFTAVCTGLALTLISHSNRIFIIQGLPALIALTISIA